MPELKDTVNPNRVQTLKTIALIDTCWSGHHPTYLKFFTKTLLKLGCRVMAFCPAPREVYDWVAGNHPQLTDQLYTFEVQEPILSSFPLSRFRPVLNAIARWQHAAAEVQKASTKVGSSPDLVFFAWLDSYLVPYLTHHVVDQIFPYHWTGLYFHPSYLRIKQRFSVIRRGPLSPNAVLKSPRCPAVAVLDEGISEKLSSQIKGKSVINFPDITDDSPPDLDFSIAKQIREKADGRRIIGLLGSQAKRKGLLTLLDVAQRAEKEDWFFVFAGRFSERNFLPQDLERIRVALQSTPHNCYFHFERIPDEPQFNALVNACDILFVAYKNFPSSSNLLTKAAVFKKPVLVSNRFCIGERVRKFKLGLSVPEDSVFHHIEALRYLCRYSELTSHQVQSNFESYQTLHSTEQLHVAFQTILDTAYLANGNQGQN